MIIRKHIKTVRFGDIKPGTVFVAVGAQTIMMKTVLSHMTEDGDCTNAVDLADGNMEYYDNDTNVHLPDCELTITNGLPI